MPSFAKGSGSPSVVPGVFQRVIPHVYIEKKITTKLLDYESGTVVIGITLPVDYTQEDLDKAEEAMTVATEIVDRRLNDEVALLLQDGSVVDHIENQYQRLQQQS